MKRASASVRSSGLKSFKRHLNFRRRSFLISAIVDENQDARYRARIAMSTSFRYHCGRQSERYPHMIDAIVMNAERKNDART